VPISNQTQNRFLRFVKNSGDHGETVKTKPGIEELKQER
jgi:hypothetical protein